MRCLDDMVWMNTTSGVLFCGPQGPDTDFVWSDVDESIVVPSTVDMLKDDTSFRFFSKFGSSVDASVLECALSSWKHAFLDDLFPWMAEGYQSEDADHLDSHWYLRNLWRNPPDHLPMDVIGGLRFGTVYSPSLGAVARRPPGARSLWKWWGMDGLVDKAELDGGWTRFTLDWVQREHVYLRVQYNWGGDGKLLYILHFVVGPPSLYLQSNEYFGTSPTLHNAEHLGEETPPSPIYLFLHPFPMTISELVSWHKGKPYFWSFDESGKSQMSEEECERWGLPVIEPDFPLILISWPIHVYSVLRDWQKARGFDPTTSDWARSMGRPELEIIGTEDCFVLVEETSDEDSEWEVLSDA
ncbi:hypothetical protein MPER_12128 [Moniliophthora perniciosa FA553]|nr:hypothetical protein MPER_12128 [Moniliophthora perniciosa FA553]